MEFKIYDSLLENIIECNSIKDIEHICSTVKILPKEHNEIIFIIIIHFYITSNKRNKSIELIVSQLKTKKSKKMIFSGERLTGGKGFIFTFNNFPKDLQNIINTYIKVITN